ncbi:acyl-CoA reductase [Succinivibrio sp.]|uniref:acyl-CoA reductase n=1 Tax=Succinivibrio sp. TaxID=2053619 RepID=UPI00386FB552
MQINSDVLKKMDFLVGSEDFLLSSDRTPCRKIFDDRVVSFLDKVAHVLLSDSKNRSYSDVIAWAFWIRKASILSEKKRYEEKLESKLGRGIAFHIAPSNVPVNFAVSLVSSLLAGNVSIVRVSSKDFVQVKIICEALSFVLKQDEFRELSPYIIIVRYERDQEISSALSAVCDLRIVWGGNATVNEFREFPIKPRAIEMTFPDRHSFVIIDADAYLKEDPKKIAELFYIDTFFTDQNACSSPRAVIWCGQNVKKAQAVFWDSIQNLVDEKYSMEPILAVDKLNSFCDVVISEDSSDLVVKREGTDNRIIRVEVKGLSDALMSYKMGGGYFFEYITNNLEEIVPLCTKECQTVSYLGVAPEKIKSLVLNHGLYGVDRIVPIGHTMDLEFYWDGYDMIDTMSRNVDVLRVSAKI